MRRQTWMGLVCLALAGTASADEPRRSFTADQRAPDEAALAAARIANRAETLARLQGFAPEDFGDRAPEIRLRLVELLVQNGDDARLIEEGRHLEASNRCFDDPDCDPVGLVADHTESDRWYAQAGRTAQGLTARWPEWGRVDEALFALGYASERRGREDEALDARLALVKRFPNSELATDALILIGDARYEADQPVKAIAAYTRAAADRDHRRWEYATFKLAWARYAVGEYDAAIDAMLEVVRDRGEQFDQALPDLLRFLADAGRAGDALTELDRLGRNDLRPTVIARLAHLAEERGDWTEAAEHHRRLLLEDPGSPRAAEWQLALATTEARAGGVEGELDQLSAYVARFGPRSAWWTEHPGAGAEAWATHERRLRALATAQHERSRKLRRSPEAATRSADLAQRAYGMWLQLHADSAHRPGMLYAMGELAWDGGRYADAYDHFSEVVALDPSGPHGEFCAAGAVHAAEKLDDTSRFVAAVDRYLQHFPASEKGFGMRYRAARALYAAERWDEARLRFEDVVAVDPRSEEAVLAANLVLDILAIREDWGGLANRAAAYRDHPQLGDPSFKRDADAVAQRAELRIIERIAAGDAGEGGRAWRAWADAHPDSELAGKALHNAAVLLAEAGDFDGALEARLVLVGRPDLAEGRRFETLAAIGFAYEQIADFGRAAEFYEELAAEPPSGREAQVADALHLAAVFRDALGQPERALANHRAFLERFPTDERVRDTELAIGRILADTRRFDEAARHLGAFADADRDPDPQYRLYARLQQARALEQVGRTSEASAVYERVSRDYRAHLDAGGAPGVATTFAAESLQKLADRRFATYDAIALVGIEASMSRREQDQLLARLIREKTEALLAVQADYKAVIDTGDGGWGVAALVGIGRSHEAMARALAESDRPTWLTEAQRGPYEGEIDNRVAIQRFKAANAYAAALEKAAELHLDTEATRLAATRLAAIDPSVPPRLPERIGAPRLDLGFGPVGYETAL